MNDSLCLGTLHAVSVYMGHYIVADQLLPLLRHLEIDIVLMSFQLLDLLIGNIQPQFLLCLCQGNPKPSPGTELLLR